MATASRSRQKRNVAQPSNGKPATTKRQSFVGSLGPADGKLPTEFVEPIQKLEKALGLPTWMLIQTEPTAMLGPDVLQLFLGARKQLAAEGRVALIVDSPGGFAQVAYKLARMLQSEAGGFTVVIPRYAKSAATLLTLGADEAMMSDDAEIGPLDAQTYDDEREQRGSALDEVQALEQLHRVALGQLDETMVLMRLNMGKRSDLLLPHACRFVGDMMRPLLEKIDTVHYAKQSRVLKVAEEYATRLLAPIRGPDEARRIADMLVNHYPEHGFIIDRREAKERRILHLGDYDAKADEALKELEICLWGRPITAFGRLKEKNDV